MSARSLPLSMASVSRLAPEATPESPESGRSRAPSSTRARLVSGVLWTVLGSVFAQGGAFSSSVIVARGFALLLATALSLGGQQVMHMFGKDFTGSPLLIVLLLGSVVSKLSPIHSSRAVGSRRVVAEPRDRNRVDDSPHRLCTARCWSTGQEGAACGGTVPSRQKGRDRALGTFSPMGRPLVAFAYVRHSDRVDAGQPRSSDTRQPEVGTKHHENSLRCESCHGAGADQGARSACDGDASTSRNGRTAQAIRIFELDRWLPALLSSIPQSAPTPDVRP